jgi:TPR repeat protein
MIARVRRTSAFVILDVPHVWTSWVREVLIAADEVLLVASPDLASLRNTDNLMKLLRVQREARAEPAIALTMTGVPKRPEISLKDFTEAVSAGPAVTFAFEPDLYGDAEQSGQLVCVTSPKSKAAQAIEVLACGFTGRSVVERKPKTKRDVPPQEAPLELEAKDALPAPEALREAEVSAPAVDVVRQVEETRMQPPQAQTPPPNVEEDGLSEFERAYVETARRKALAALESKRKTKRRVRRSRGMVRFFGVAAAASALGAVTLWSFEQRTEQAQAASPPPQAESVALPAAPPADPFTAMEADYTQAMAMLAQNDARGLALLTRTAEAGLPLAQYRLAKLYESGDGVELDPMRVLQWTERAAASGNVRAMHDLGFYYARGDAATLDETAAFRWFRQAAEFGLADSQYNLGILYQQGRGVSADMAEALFWFTLAADQGDGAAQQRLIDLGADLSAIHIEQARARADGFTPRAPNARANGDWRPRSATPPAAPAEASEPDAATAD